MVRSKKVIIIKYTLRSLAAIAIAVVMINFKLDVLESYLFDLRVRLSPATKKSGHIELVAIDPVTLSTLGHLPAATDHQQFLKMIQKSKPKAILYLVEMEHLEGSVPELEAFARVAATLPFYLGVDILPIKGFLEDITPQPPLDKLTVVPAPNTHDKHTFAKDGVSRRLIYSFLDTPLFHAQIASEINGLHKKEDYTGLFTYKRTTQALVDFRPKGTYQTHSFIEVAKGNVDPKIFKDKIIILGSDTKSSIGDYVQTPYSRDIIALSILEYQANMIDTLILNTAPTRAPKWLRFAITLVISFLTIFFVLGVRPVRGLMLLVATGLTFSLIGLAAYSWFHLILDMSQPLLTIFVCYYFFIPYRLIVESKKNWEILQKNKLLTQVEELKNNFIRMMSHDLKTPLARIQGMADLVLTDKNKVSQDQAKALHTIKNSSVELSDFVGSILNLGRIESKEVKLLLKSRDMNALVQEVITKFEFYAQQKNITLIAELEPLFSIKIDAELIRQVISNLIENAIKYSGPNTKIMVSTEERDGRIIVQVADQGIGISADEKDNIFEKFFRSPKVTNKDIKGSGLGLYLSNYFIQLHQGKILVESEINGGSTFSMEIPVDLS